MTDDKPLHVRVAEALGWTIVGEDRSYGWLGKPPADVMPYNGVMSILGAFCHQVPRYDTDWSVTGPIIESYDIGIMPTYGFLGEAEPWTAAVGNREQREGDVYARAATPLIAVCHLILALKEAGKL